MKLKYSLLVAAAVLASCAPYKQLKPDPAISAEEQGYIELKRGKKSFELKSDKKYFIEFPPPAENNFYLVIQSDQKSKVSAYLTPSLFKKKTPGPKIDDESGEAPDQLVFPIGKRDSSYYLMIENVSENISMPMQYRYVPQWRFKFENKHAEYKRVLEQSRADRTVYTTLGESFHFNGFTFRAAIDTTANDFEQLQEIHKQLLAIESIFPPSIINSTDKAYQNYNALKKELEEEMAFQQSYLAVLDFFKRIKDSKGNPAALMEHIEAFIVYFESNDRLARNVLLESRRVLKDRLTELVAFYEGLLREKKTADPFDEERFHMNAFKKLPKLYEVAHIQKSQAFTALFSFIDAFDTSARALAEAAKGMKTLQREVAESGSMPSNSFFSGIVRKASALRDSAPEPLANSHGSYASYACATALNQKIDEIRRQLDQQVEEYTEAAYLVPQLNTLRQREDYRGMLGLLRQYMHLDFLLAKYRELDRLSIEQQRKAISAALSQNQWAKAEEGLRALHNDRSFLNPGKIEPHKELTVRALEDSLYMGIDRVSRLRVDQFLEENVNTLKNVDSLYTDSVFLPAYTVSFTSGGKRELVQRQQELIAHLAALKKNEFPARAITLLFDQFTKNPGDNGVLKARAIVAHGEHYEGNSKKIKRRVAEVNPWASKWIVKPKIYRRVYALPITTSRGENRYFVRFNIRIPTEAKFPVFDVNIKLTKEIAGNAATEQWYEKIEMNGSPLKNEGRFTITAPTADNGYVCQITPVQMNKDKSNHLDIYFKHNSFTVHSLSVMVQKPIMKKN